MDGYNTSFDRYSIVGTMCVGRKGIAKEAKIFENSKVKSRMSNVMD